MTYLCPEQNFVEKNVFFYEQKIFFVEKLQDKNMAGL